MTRWPLYLFCAALLLVGCNRAPENKEAVREAVIEHVKKAGLDMNLLDVTVKDVKFEGNKATADVAFVPKKDPQNGMTMGYQLERRGDKWQVMGKGSSATSHGGAMGQMPPGQMPPGQMPSGHPPVTPGGATPMPTSPDMPAGHPPVPPPGPTK